jgi:hypothetical protein
MRHKHIVAAALGGLFCAGWAQAADPPPPADPLTVTIQSGDAERFARLWLETGGAPTAEQLERGYLDNASYGVGVFTPHRIENGGKLARVIAANRAVYDRAVRECLPVAKAANADLRSIYLGLAGLLPEAKLPQIYLAFGANNSGGTAGRGAQVLGVEVLCRINPTMAGFRTTLRHFFAHETVHTLQGEGTEKGRATPLLDNVLREGAADFIAYLVTGEVPDPARAAWAAPREAQLWPEFQADVVTAKTADFNSPDRTSPGRAALHRWVANASPEPWKDRPHELGYWLGMRIWQSYFDAAADKRQAVRDMLNWDDPEEVLRRSGYSGGSPAAK